METAIESPALAADPATFSSFREAIGSAGTDAAFAALIQHETVVDVWGNDCHPFGQFAPVGP